MSQLNPFSILLPDQSANIKEGVLQWRASWLTEGQENFTIPLLFVGRIVDELPKVKGETHVTL